jgi:hypothetical protein
VSEWCQDDVGIADALKMSQVICRVKLGTGVYSVGDRTTEVYPGWMKDRIGWSIVWRVEFSETIPYAGFGGYGKTMVKWFVCKLVGDHGKLFGRTSFHDTNENCLKIATKEELSFRVIIL